MSKITQLTEDTTPTHDDLIETVTDPAGTPLSRKAKLSSLFFVLQQWVFGSDAGSTDTYVVTLSPAPAAYVTGQHYRFKANTANTGACTVNFNSLGAKIIKKAQGGITTDLADNDIRAGQWVDLVYDGTNMQMQSTSGNTYVVPTAVVNDQTGTTYTLQASDNGKVITCSNASAITVTVPSGLGAGFNCMIIQKGAGQVIFSPSSSTVNNRQSHTKIAGQYGVVSLIAYVADVFVLAGDTAA